MSDLLVLDPLLDDAGAAALVELWHEFGEYGQYSNEGFRPRSRRSWRSATTRP